MQIYTDGSCLKNPGPGAWAYVVVHDDGTTCRWGSETTTTNNAMELTAIAEALRYAISTGASDTTVYSDSKYCINGITQWIPKWKTNSWLTSNNKPVKNKELWQELDELNTQLTVVYRHVKGHSGDVYNTMADTLANSAASKLQQESTTCLQSAVAS